MNSRKALLAMFVAGSLGLPLSAYAAVNIDVDVAPPAPVYENVVPRAGYVYTPGYYRWDDAGHKHVWVKGDYVAERKGEHYVAPAWEARNGRYHFNEGRWEHDHGQ